MSDKIMLICNPKNESVFYRLYKEKYGDDSKISLHRVIAGMLRNYLDMIYFDDMESGVCRTMQEIEQNGSCCDEYYILKNMIGFSVKDKIEVCDVEASNKQ